MAVSVDVSLPAPGTQYASVVSPTWIVSPSSSRWRPCSRRPATNVPLRERPSSVTVHSPATGSIAA